jgi:hypothetical protein
MIAGKSKVKLVSKNPYNFRHGKEDPIVVGIMYIVPKGLIERLCYQVLYPTDMKIDYIPFSSVEYGDWEFSHYTKEDSGKNLASHGI